MKKLNQKGFTLVELLVVIAIIGILALVAVPALFKNINKSKIAKVESDYNAVKSSIVAYYAENNVLANNINSLNVDGLSDGKETPIGGVYGIIAKDEDNKIISSEKPVTAYKIKHNGEIDKEISLHNYGDSFLTLQGWQGKEMYINNEQFKKLIDDIGYENIFISYPPTGTGYQTSRIYIRLANNILPKPIK